ncbi:MULTISPECIES: TniQ family protein [Hyphomicrobiales]|jgi:hypothetical protein|uniref:TniQ family protein n=1 Tax=Hyphomicrobiales TaxID=356 RepID=UPI000646C709|nr:MULTISPECIES: TniQ family protein [Hyphomicrobiales]RZS83892.1 TniQ protein [Phyllobacterium myrsinacearum]
MMLKPVEVASSETIFSIIARLAAINGSGNARAMVRHLGISYMGFDRPSDPVYETLSAYTGMSADTFAKASIHRHDKFSINVGGSVVSGRTVSRSAPRFCSLCVMEDIDKRTGRPVVRPFERFSWTIRDVAGCHKHGVVLDHASGPDELRREFVKAVSERISMVEFKASRVEPLELSKSDRYFAARLDHEADPVPDLDALPYYVAKQLCERLGVLDASGPDAHVPTSVEELAVVRERGFNLIGDTAGSLRWHLENLTSAFWHSSRPKGAQHLFGNLYRYLDNHQDDDHKGLRDLLRDVATDALPIGPTDSFLGSPKKRRWHSVISFAREYGISPLVAEGNLTREGFIPPQSGFHREAHSRIVFDAELAERAFPRQELLPRMDLVKRMRLERLRNTAIFAKQGPNALKPRPDPAGINRLYSITEAENLLAKLTRIASETKTPDMRRICEAAGPGLCFVDDVIEMLADGKLEQVFFVPDQFFEGIHVSTKELRAKADGPDQGWVSCYDVAEEIDVCEADAMALMRKGFLKSQPVQHRKQTHLLTTKELLTDFNRRHISLTALAKLNGKKPTEMFRKLNNRNIVPAIDAKSCQSRIYYRHDVDQ